MSVVLVVGSSGAGKRTLVQGLLRLLETDGEPRVSLGTNISSSDGGDIHNSTAVAATTTRTPDRRVSIEQADAEFDAYKAFIRTKYFEAEVTLWRQANASSILALRTVKLEGLEGIVVVFDLREVIIAKKQSISSKQQLQTWYGAPPPFCDIGFMTLSWAGLCQESSWEEAEQWAAFVDHKGEDLAFRLCVGTKLDLLQENEGPVENTPPFDAIDNPGHGKEREKASTAGEATASVTASQGLQERRRRCLEWCLDHGFEYVEADCLHPEIGRDLREKEGVPRVAEAFQSNVWTGMDFRTDSRPSALAAAGRSRGVHGGGGGGDDEVGTGVVPESNGWSSEEAQAEPRGSTSDGDGEIVSEYLQGFVNPAEGSDEFGYGALGSDDEGGGGVDGGAGGGGDGGEEQDPGCEGYTEGIEPQVSEEARSRGARGPSQGSGIERGHVELQAQWELLDQKPSRAAPEVDVFERPGGRKDGPAASSLSSHEKAGGDIGNPEETRRGGGGEVASPANISCYVSDGSVSVPSKGGGDLSGYGVPSGQVAREDVEGRVDAVAGGVFGGVGREKGRGEGKMASGLEESLLRAAGGEWEDEMEQLMSEVRKAKAAGDAVSDRERRARAANVAMRLAALLGEDSEDDECASG